MDTFASNSHASPIPCHMQDDKSTQRPNAPTACMPETPASAPHRKELTKELSNSLVPKKGSASCRTHWRPLKIQAPGTYSQSPLSL